MIIVIMEIILVILTDKKLIMEFETWSSVKSRSEVLGTIFGSKWGKK
jgi:hypothetical protein